MSVFTDATLKEITDEKRVHNQLQPKNVVMYESGLHQVNSPTDHGTMREIHNMIKNLSLLPMCQAK